MSQGSTGVGYTNVERAQGVGHQQTEDELGIQGSGQFSRRFKEDKEEQYTLIWSAGTPSVLDAVLKRPSMRGEMVGEGNLVQLVLVWNREKAHTRASTRTCGVTILYISQPAKFPDQPVLIHGFSELPAVAGMLRKK